MTHTATETETEQLVQGLKATPPRLSPRYFYDERGSKLFREITRTDEYYPTRTELSILQDKGDELATHLEPGTVVVELGGGTAEKVIALLEHLDEPRAHRPIDISREALDESVRAVGEAFPELTLLPFEGDFTAEEAYAGLPEAPVCVYYPGSTIGNFEPREATAFLSSLRERLSDGDRLLLGADLVKDERVLQAAYNDARGLTADFNRNMLRHLNERFGTTFQPEAFEHRALYNVEERRIEMHLVPRDPQRVVVDGEVLTFMPGEPIHTESSYKFDLESLEALGAESGFQLETIVTDEREWFAEVLFAVP
ncbi:MAG: L-histidine N(alpha)-methyltransferase [Planctomycetes bacterium]|nr:L-histidine N(alpha)-methyltransferase [Planctomycetota bacterium]